MNTRLQTYSETHAQKKGGYAWILFLIWPFLAVLSAFKNYREPWAKNVFWAFCAFFGYTIILSEQHYGMDIYGYVAEFQALHQQSMGIDDILKYFSESGEIDILRTLLAYLLSRVTGEATMLTLAYGIIFGYFLSRNMWFLLERLEGKIAPVTFVILLCFFMVNPIWEINGFRMWTATHIFIYGLLPFLFDGKKNGLWISMLSLLVHFSFIVPVGVLIAYLLLGNRLWMFFGFYLSTLFLSEMNFTAFNQMMDAYAPEMFRDRTSGYTSEAYVEGLQEAATSRPWFLTWRRLGLTYLIMGFFFIMMLKGREFFRENVGWHNLFSFTMLFYGVANIMSLIPSGGRFTTIAHLCALALIALYLQNRPQEKLMKYLTIISFPALLLFIVVGLRLGLPLMSATWIIGNPILAVLFADSHFSLYDLMRMIL